MANETRIEGEQGAFRIVGRLSFETVPDLQRRSSVLFADATDIDVDLERVERADSAGLALIIGWLREARWRGASLTLHNIPEQMRALARLSGLEDLLPVAER
jgi:phospholipid transport system transporter-binding protein